MADAENALLIVGCGDVARRALPALLKRYTVHALVRNEADAAEFADRGAVVHRGDLDSAQTLREPATTARTVLHLAPPPADGDTDPRTRRLLHALSQPPMVARTLVYLSTSGVYGDCRGDRVDEDRAPAPTSPRARRRADAEAAIRASGLDWRILRVPGIYAEDRLPLERLRRGTPVLRAEDDVYTNHIHADDLAQAIVHILERAPTGGVYNVCDDSELKMGDWFDFLADRAGLPRPPRIPRDQAAQSIPEALLSFMSESRRLSNRRLKALGFALRHPTVFEGVPNDLRSAYARRSDAD